MTKIEIRTLTTETTINYESTCINSVMVKPSTDSITNEIIINFNHGGHYDYTIPFDTLENFLFAESIGKAFHKYIRGKFESTKL